MAYTLIIDQSKSTGALPVHLCGVRASLVFYVVLCRSYCLSFFEEGGGGGGVTLHYLSFELPVWIASLCLQTILPIILISFPL